MTSVTLESLEAQLNVLKRLREERRGEKTYICRICYIPVDEHMVDPSHKMQSWPLEHTIIEIQSSIDSLM